MREGEKKIWLGALDEEFHFELFFSFFKSQHA